MLSPIGCINGAARHFVLLVYDWQWDGNGDDDSLMDGVCVEKETFYFKCDSYCLIGNYLLSVVLLLSDLLMV